MRSSTKHNKTTKPDPNIVNNYRIQQSLFSDDFSTTFLATCESDQRNVALKVILKKDVELDLESCKIINNSKKEKEKEQKLLSKNEYADYYIDDDDEEEQENEEIVKMKKQKKTIIRCVQKDLDIMYTFKHPNILSVIDFFEDDMKYYIVEQPIVHNLRYHMSKKIRLRENACSIIVHRLIQCLEVFHQNNIVFGNLMPENIFFSNSTTTSFPNSLKLGGFYYTTVLSTTQKEMKAQWHNLYSPPEFFANEYKDPTDKSDVWCIGVLLYEMLTGKLPWIGKNSEEITQKITNATFSIPDYVSEPCSDVIKACICVSIKKRATLSQILQFPWMRLGEPVKKTRNVVSPTSQKLSRAVISSTMTTSAISAEMTSAISTSTTKCLPILPILPFDDNNSCNTNNNTNNNNNFRFDQSFSTSRKKKHTSLTISSSRRQGGYDIWGAKSKAPIAGHSGSRGIINTSESESEENSSMKSSFYERTPCDDFVLVSPFTSPPLIKPVHRRALTTQMSVPYKVSLNLTQMSHANPQYNGSIKKRKVNGAASNDFRFLPNISNF